MNDRQRTILAIVLMVAVALLPSLFYSGDRQTETTDGAPVPATPDRTDAQREEPALPPALPEIPPPRSELVAPAGTAAGDNGEPVIVRSGLYEFTFSTRGARLIGASLYEYESLAPGESGPVQLIPEDSEFLAYRLVFGSDTVDLADWTFEPSADLVTVDGGRSAVSWVARRGAVTIHLDYTFRPDDYLFDVEGRIEGLSGTPPLLLVGLGPQLRSAEADSVEDQRSFGVVTKARKTANEKFSSLDPGERLDLSGPFEWVAIKSKYFLAAVMAIEDGAPRFGGGTAIGGARSGRNATQAHVTVSLPVPRATFGHSVYVGPQEFRRLANIGHDLEDANPYGWIFRPIIRPVSIVIVHALLWGHENLNMAYGWLLVLFGIGIRVLLWPLNQKAMRSQMAMQALAPEVEALRKKYQNDQTKLSQETMALYKKHGANPLGGCLPVLLPMPILFAFFFVFLNTIELRGVPFLWLPDLSRADPLYIIPLLMGVSMFAVSKLGQRGIPPTPQTKVMMYVMPVFMTVIFMNFSSGLNLYYASQNLASLPQQWLIAKERAKRQQGTG